MTKYEINKMIDKKETERFLLAMKDRWNGNDYDKDRQLVNEIKALRLQLGE